MKEQQSDVEATIAPMGASVLISGASFAGLATAFWMHRLGYCVTIVEVADRLRKGGTPVDINPTTIDIVRRMGLLDVIRAKSLPRRTLEFKNIDDVTEARLPAQPSALDGPDEQPEINRDDLLDLMFDAVAADVDIVFGQSIHHLKENADGIDVSFADGSRRSFTFVFGCDGTRSNTRQLVFGKHDDHMRFLNVYSVLKVVPKTFIERDITQVYSVPGRTVMVNGYADKTDIIFGFHADSEISYDYRDKAQQRRLIHRQFEGLGWRTPHLLKEIDIDDDFYFDKTCQIRMPIWSKGRVALVGDAGYCPSPFAGMGGSMAIIGAAALADAFERHQGDYTAAFRDYDATLRPFAERVQNDAVSFGIAMFAPKTQAAIAERDRLLSDMIKQ